MKRRPSCLPKTLALTLSILGCTAATAAPFGVPFIELPQGSAGHGGDTSAYFGLQLDPNTFDPIYPSPNVHDCPKSPAGGFCRTDFNNFDTRYRYDSVRWRMFDGGRTGLIGNVTWRDGGMDMFRKIYFGYGYSATAPGNLTPFFNQPINFGLYSDYSAYATSQTFSLTTEAIDLNNVRLSLDAGGATSISPLLLNLDGPSTGIRLSNSSLLLGVSKLRVFVDGRFTIDALEGRNSIEQLTNRLLIDTPTSINISPGAWLTFSDFSQGLEFRGKNNSLDAVGLNQDGGLVLQRGNWRFANGQANFSQGAALNLVGSGTSATFGDMRFSSGAKISMANGTSLDANSVLLGDSTMTMGEGTQLVAKAIEVTSGNTRIDSRDYASRWGTVQTNYLGIVDGGRLELNGLGDFLVKGRTDFGIGLAAPGQGAVLNLNRADVTAYDTVEMYNGAELNIADLAIFRLRPDYGSHEKPDALLRGVRGVGAAAGNPARINVGPTGTLSVVYGGQIDLSDEYLRVKVNGGALEVRGNLRGSGYVEGNGAVTLLKEGTAYGQKVSGGWLFPGTLAQPIATLSIDPQLYFGQGSQLRVNVGRDAQGQLAHGKVLYGAGDVTLDGNLTLALAAVRGQTPLSATELNGRSITMLAARDAAVTGTIQPSVYQPRVDVSAMPALLTWRVLDLQTNQHPDITLQADLLPFSGLQKGGGQKTNRSSGLGLLVATAVQNPSGPIAGALNTLTNAQLGVSGTVSQPPDPSASLPGATPLPTPAQAQGSAVAQQNSWHPEPYSSYIATGLAQVANLRNMVFERAMLTDPSGNRGWADAAGFRGSIDGQDDLGSFSYRMNQLVIGKDMGAMWGGSWGAFVAMNDRKIDEHDLQTQAISGTTLGLGAYWRQQGQTWTTLAQWGLAYGEHDSTRQSAVGANLTTLRARYTSASAQAAVRFSAPWFEYQGMALSHEFGGSVSWYRQAGFDETGDPDFGFRVKAATADAYIAHAGAYARFPALSLQHGLRPTAFARLEHDFAKNSDHAIEASLLANPQLCAQFVGQGRGPTSAVLGLSIVTETPGPWQIQGGLNHAWHTHGRDWGADINIRYSW